MSRYQVILVAVLVLWPLAIIALLFLMEHLERYIARSDAETPKEAGLEPVSGTAPEREVKIVFGGREVGDAGHGQHASGAPDQASATQSTSSRAPLGSEDTATAARAGGSAPTNSA